MYDQAIKIDPRVQTIKVNIFIFFFSKLIILIEAIFIIKN